MSRRVLLFWVAGILLLMNEPVWAGTLTMATWVQVTQGVPMTRTIDQLNASGGSTDHSIALSLTYSFTGTSFAPGDPVDLAKQIAQGGIQAIAATPGMAIGTPVIPGTVILMTAIHTGMGVNQSMFKVGANTIVQYPLRVGGAGHFTSTFLAVGVPHKLTVDFFAWTPGSIMFSGLTSRGNALPNVTAEGSFNLTTYSGGGTVSLIAPAKISIDGAMAQRRTAAFTKLKLSFFGVPLPDLDGDGVADFLDNCPSIANADQGDRDNNGTGDACNNAEDADGDDWADSLDNCPAASNPSQTDTDGERIGDACDPNPTDPTNRQAVFELNACLAATPDCGDGIDNDGDGNRDFPADTGCDSATDTLETPLECSDGIDNDGDGRIDFGSDPGCANADDISEFSSVQCDNGRDDDGDTKIDWRVDGTGDSDCVNVNDNSEFRPQQSSCGFGPELAFLLPILWWLRRRQTRT